jgi:putative NADPH-quinone reductase
MSILLIYSHPDPRRSKMNKPLKEAIKSLPSVTLSDLYEKYPYFHVDVKQEQDLLLKSDTILFQFPIYWYSVPPLLKMWFDSVLTHGFAYGSGGNSLKGKKFQVIATTGGDTKAYTPEGMHERPFQEFMPPLIQTARLCQMDWQEPIVIHGAGRLSNEDVQRESERVLGFLQKYLK